MSIHLGASRAGSGQSIFASTAALEVKVIQMNNSADARVGLSDVLGYFVCEVLMKNWTVFVDPEGKDMRAYIDCNGRCIAHVFSNDAAERDKNAALISAAPDLLKIVSAFVDDCDKAGIKDINIKYLSDARLAIKKATA